MDTAAVFEAIRPRYPEFKDRVALVTGSSRGIGKGIVLRLAREGMKIVLHGVDRGELETTLQEFQGLGVPVHAVEADFARDADVDRLFQETISAFGTLDLLVNNAADLRRTDIDDADLVLLDHQLAVNVRTPYKCALLAAQLMRPLKRGNIINISSVGGLRAHWKGLPYDMTKGAIDSMTQAMALELARDGIRVNAIAPGAIRREDMDTTHELGWQQAAARIPQARFGTPIEIGGVVAFLASEDASYITGQVVYVDGGITAQLSPPDSPL